MANRFDYFMLIKTCQTECSGFGQEVAIVAAQSHCYSMHRNYQMDYHHHLPLIRQNLINYCLHSLAVASPCSCWCRTHYPIHTAIDLHSRPLAAATAWFRINHNFAGLELAIIDSQHQILTFDLASEFGRRRIAAIVADSRRTIAAEFESCPAGTPCLAGT